MPEAARSRHVRSGNRGERVSERWTKRLAVGSPWRPGRGARTFARARWALAAVAAALLSSGCSGTREVEDNSGIFGSRTDTLEARLVPVGGSIARGTVRVAQTAKGTQLSVYFYNVAAGTYRVAIHADGNCTSPNGFSAGPPWVPPGAAQPVVITLTVGENGADISQPVPGLTLRGPTGVAGRSAVIHQGWNSPLEAVPDLPNNRVACGAFSPVLPVFPNL
jgi:Cu/Zn superoxide dismutase